MKFKLINKCQLYSFKKVSDLVEMSIGDIENGKLENYNTRVLINARHENVHGLAEGRNKTEWNEVSDLFPNWKPSLNEFLL